MPAKFEFYQNPNSKLTSKKQYAARLVGTRTVKIEELVDLISGSSAVTRSEALAVLSALPDAMIQVLKKGNRMHIEKVGYFYPTLSTQNVTDISKKNKKKVNLKSIGFTPESQLKKRLASEIELQQTEKKGLHSQQLDPEEIDARLTAYFKSHLFLTRQAFEKLCGFKRCLALKHINRLIAEKRLENSGTRRQPVYIPVGMNYRK